MHGGWECLRLRYQLCALCASVFPKEAIEERVAANFGPSLAHPAVPDVRQIQLR